MKFLPQAIAFFSVLVWLVVQASARSHNWSSIPDEFSHGDAVSDRELMIGGDEVLQGNRTYVVGIRSSVSGSSYCTGVLIAPTWVLTVSYCYGQIGAVSIGVRARSGSDEGEVIEVVNQTQHQNTDNIAEDDLLLLELKTASKYTPVTMISANGSELDDPSKGMVIGWGTTSSTSTNAANKLQQVSVILEPQNLCKERVNVQSSQMCTRGSRVQDVCNDVGAPLIVVNKGVQVLAGVLLSANDCAKNYVPAVYGRVSYSREWIKSITGV